jgi:hypothetical protein
MQGRLPFVHKGILQLAVIVLIKLWDFRPSRRCRDQFKRRLFAMPR